MNVEAFREVLDNARRSVRNEAQRNRVVEPRRRSRVLRVLLGLVKRRRRPQVSSTHTDGALGTAY